MRTAHFGGHCEKNDWQTGVKNITLPQTSFADGKTLNLVGVSNNAGYFIKKIDKDLFLKSFCRLRRTWTEYVVTCSPRFMQACNVRAKTAQYPLNARI